MNDGQFRRVHGVGEMLTELKTLFAPEPTAPPTRHFRRSELFLQGIAIVLAFVVVAVSSLVAGTAVRVRSVPIEVANLTPELLILDQSAGSVQMQLRGSAWALDAIAPDRITVRLRSVKEL